MSKHKDLPPAAVALLVVVAVLALGFHYLGPRERLRAISADARRVDDLRAIAAAVVAGGRKQPPAALADLQPGLVLNLKDPVTQSTYEYRPTSATTYELCAGSPRPPTAITMSFGRGPPVGIIPKGATVIN